MQEATYLNPDFIDGDSCNPTGRAHNPAQLAQAALLEQYYKHACAPNSASTAAGGAGAGLGGVGAAPTGVSCIHGFAALAQQCNGVNAKKMNAAIVTKLTGHALKMKQHADADAASASAAARAAAARGTPSPIAADTGIHGRGGAGAVAGLAPPELHVDAPMTGTLYMSTHKRFCGLRKCMPSSVDSFPCVQSYRYGCITFAIFASLVPSPATMCFAC